ncbi:hypothetical protein LPTSP3_g26390 [Leptospira kobayashii]|uniref:DUF2071 domain-containing protein n=1 Tax=Leptospira kobayashii TaxID=1917830 RepID=A0ABN6KIC2_9LEPT|nr:hypothetical protein LPTSP3_g26390 [Leptospira kobayashii]
MFLHYKVPLEVVRKLVPKGLDIDMYEGDVWVSLVAFTMDKVHPEFLFSWERLSRFHEVNFRTYVIRDNKPGVYFLSIEANNRISCYLATMLSGLRYQYQKITRTVSNPEGEDEIFSYFFPETKSLNVEYRLVSKSRNDDKKSKLDVFLTERYCLYNEEGNHLFRFEIYHEPWQLTPVRLRSLEANYSVGGMSLAQVSPDLVHYSPGVKVSVWGKEKL